MIIVSTEQPLLHLAAAFLEESIKDSGIDGVIGGRARWTMTIIRLHQPCLKSHQWFFSLKKTIFVATPSAKATWSSNRRLPARMAGRE